MYGLGWEEKNWHIEFDLQLVILETSAYRMYPWHFTLPRRHGTYLEDRSLHTPVKWAAAFQPKGDKDQTNWGSSFTCRGTRPFHTILSHPEQQKKKIKKYLLKNKKFYVSPRPLLNIGWNQPRLGCVPYNKHFLLQQCHTFHLAQGSDRSSPGS